MEVLQESIRTFEQWQRERSDRRMRIAALMRHGMAKIDTVAEAAQPPVIAHLEESLPKGAHVI